MEAILIKETVKLALLIYLDSSQNFFGQMHYLPLICQVF